MRSYRTCEASFALGYPSSNSHASYVLSKFHISMNERWRNCKLKKGGRRGWKHGPWKFWVASLAQVKLLIVHPMLRKQCYFLRPNFHFRKTKTQSSEGKFKWWKWKEDVSFSISKPYLYWEIPLFQISILARGVISWIVKFKGKKKWRGKAVSARTRYILSLPSARRLNMGLASVAPEFFIYLYIN